MKVSLVFDPDLTLGSDPNDPLHRPYRLGEFFDSDKVDTLLLVRRYGDEYPGGFETQVWCSGIWENVTSDQVDQAMATIGEWPQGEKR